MGHPEIRQSSQFRIARRRTYLCVYDIRILHHFCEKEALLIICLGTAIRRIYITNTRETTVGAARGVDGNKGIPSPVLISSIASDSISIIVAFDDFGAGDVNRVSDIEAVLVVKLGIVFIKASGVPGEDLRPNASLSTNVRIVATGDKLKTKVDNVLSSKDGAAENEISSVETGKMFRRVNSLSAIKLGKEKKIRTRSWSGCEVLHA